MGDLLIRGLADHAHDDLKRRAEAAGTSLQAYVSQVLEQHTRQMSLDEWLRRLDDLPRHTGVSGSATVRAVRGELP